MTDFWSKFRPVLIWSEHTTNMRALVCGGPMCIIYTAYMALTYLTHNHHAHMRFHQWGCCFEFSPYWNSHHFVALSPWRQPDVVKQHINPPTFIQGEPSPWGGCRVRRHLLTFPPAAAKKKPNQTAPEGCF